MLLAIILMASPVETQPAEPQEIVFADLVREPAPLVPAPADWEYLGFVHNYADRYLLALRRGQKADFLKLHLESENTANAHDAVRLAFGNHAGFRALRRMKSNPETAVFRYESNFEPGAEVIDDGLGNLAANYSCTICFCIRGDCSGRWPRRDTDADNREGRPYVCTEFGPFKVYGDGWLPAFLTWPPRESHIGM